MYSFSKTYHLLGSKRKRWQINWRHFTPCAVKLPSTELLMTKNDVKNLSALRAAKGSLLKSYCRLRLQGTEIFLELPHQEEYTDVVKLILRDVTSCSQSDCLIWKMHHASASFYCMYQRILLSSSKIFLKIQNSQLKLLFSQLILNFSLYCALKETD